MLGLGNRVTNSYVQSSTPYVNPSSFSNLTLWLQFNKDIFVNEPDVGYSNDDSWSHNDKIFRWQDQSGNNNHAVQDTSGDKPRSDMVDGNGLADKGSVKFANRAKFMDLTENIELTGDFTIMIRFRLTSTNNPIAFLGNSATDLLKLEDSRDVRAIIGGSGVSTWYESSAAVLPEADPTKRSIITLTRSSGALSVHLNSGTASGSWKDIHDDVDWDAAENHTDSDTFTISNIGTTSDDNTNFNGNFFDVLIYNGTALTTAQRKQNYDYLVGQTL